MSYRKDYDLTRVRPLRYYTPSELTRVLGMANPFYIHGLCRQGRLRFRVDARGRRVIRGKDVLAWRVATQSQRGSNRQVKWDAPPPRSRYGFPL